MQIDRARVAAGNQLRGIFSVHNTLGQGAIVALVFGPTKILHVQGADARSEQVGVQWPGARAFGSGVAHVEAYGQMRGIVCLEKFMQIPQGCAHVVAAGMVLVNRLQTEFFVECHEVLEHRPQFVHLVENGLLEVVLVVAHSVTLDAELGGDLELLDVQLVIGVVDARGHDGHF